MTTSTPAGDRPGLLADAVAGGEARLKDLQLEGPARTLPGVASKVLRGKGSDDVIGSIQRFRADLAAVDAVLKDVYDRGVAADRREAEAEPFGKAWLNVVRWALNDTQEAARDRLDEWLTTWSDALAAAQYRCARDVAVLEVPGANEQLTSVIRPRMVRLSDTLVEEDWTGAVDQAGDVLDAGTRLPEILIARLRVLRSRVFRKVVEDEQAAMNEARLVERSSAASLYSRDLARAAIAEVHLDRGELDDVHRLVDGILDRDVGAPDLLLAAGRLAEVEERFDDADEIYDAVALRVGPAAVRPSLMRDVPRALLWRAARLIRDQDPVEALELVDAWLEAAEDDERDVPDRRQLLERASLLDELKGPPPGEALHSADAYRKAALAYRDAAERYSDTGSKRALSLYERAVDLDPATSERHWDLAEALRMEAMAVPWAPDLEKLARAREELQRGFELGVATPEQCWVFWTAALIADLDDGAGADDPELLIERGLLLDRAYASGYRLLSQFLREHGYVAEALQTAVVGAGLDDADELTAGEHVRCLSHAGRFDEAIETAAAYLLELGYDEDLCLEKAAAERRIGDTDGALSTLEASDSEAAVFERAMTYAAMDDSEAERACYRRVLAAEEGTHTPSVLGWAAYRLGDLDGAVRSFEDIYANDPRAQSAGLDLGQALLARGADGDLQRGRDVLLEAVERSTSADNLVHVHVEELRLLERDVTGLPHEAFVAETTEAARLAIDDRVALLRERRRPTDRPAARLAAARQAEQPGRFVESLALLQAVEADLALAELPPRLAVVVDEVVADGDWFLHRDGPSAACELWRSAMPFLDRGLETSSTPRDIDARLALADFEARGATDPTAVDRLRERAPEDVLGVVDLFTRDVQTLWTHLDGLRALADAWQLEIPVVQSTFCNFVYATGREVPQLSASPFVVPMEIAFGSDLVALDLPAALDAEILRLRPVIADDMGVQLPGVRFTTGAPLPPDAVRIDVYGRTVTTFTVDPGSDDAAALTARRFEDAVRDNLFRWVTIDELGLWANDWDLPPIPDGDGTPDAAGWVVTDRSTRLRLTRILRWLVREGVSVRDRAAIRQAFEAAEASGRTELLDQLADVRRSLYPLTLGRDRQAEIVALPQPLQDEVTEAIDAAGADAWAVPRARMHDLADRLKSWLTEMPAPPAAIGVRDGRARPFVWHLLADERPRVFVVADEELP